MWNELILALRRFCRRHFRRRASAPPVKSGQGIVLRPFLLTLGVGILLAAALISVLELRLRPLVEHLAVHQVDNRVTQEINRTILEQLSDLEITYDDLVSIRRDGGENISAVTSNMARINWLRGEIVEKVLRTVQDLDVDTLSVPLGSLFQFDLLWAKGPSIQVESLVVGTISAEMESKFESSGINQTLHRIVLHIRVPLTVLLPGDAVKTEVSADLCVAETIIVGKVPDTYLQLGQG